MSTRYAALKPPLRISPSELTIYAKLASRWSTSKRAPRVLVMGATPDFYHLPWPEHTDLLAVDRSADMLSAVWPGTDSQRMCQDWTSMSLPDASRDLLLCDGGLTFFAYPRDLQALASNVTRIMAPGALFIVRLYVDAAGRETPEDIFQLVEQGKIKDSSELKLRLWFAVKAGDGDSVCLADVWRCFNTRFADEDQFIRSFNWPVSEWQSMQAYKGINDVFHFPSVEQVSEAFTRADKAIRLQASIVPDGPCHQHLNVLAFRRDS